MYKNKLRRGLFVRFPVPTADGLYWQQGHLSTFTYDLFVKVPEHITGFYLFEKPNIEFDVRLLEDPRSQMGTINWELLAKSEWLEEEQGDSGIFSL